MEYIKWGSAFGFRDNKLSLRSFFGLVVRFAGNCWPRVEQIVWNDSNIL